MFSFSRQITAVLMCALVCSVECRVPDNHEFGFRGVGDALLSGEASKLLSSGVGMNPEFEQLIHSFVEGDFTDEYMKTKLDNFLQVQAQTGDPVSLGLVISGLVILGVIGVVKISKIAAKKYTQMEIDKAKKQSMEAQKEFCNGLNDIMAHSDLQQRVSDMMLVWASERADQMGDKASADALVKFANRISVMLRVVHGHADQHARRKANDVCPGMINSKGNDRDASYWEAMLNDKDLDIKEDVVSLILTVAQGVTTGIHSGPGGLAVTSLKVLKTVIFHWNDEAAAQMIGKAIAINVVKQTLQFFVPQIFVAILAVELAITIGDFAVDIGRFWEKIRQAQAQAKKDMLNYYFIICAMLQKQADAENLRNTMLKDLVDHVNKLSVESINGRTVPNVALLNKQMQLEEEIDQPVAVAVDYATARTTVMGWIEKAKATYDQREGAVVTATAGAASYHNTKLLLKDICTNLVHRRKTFEQSFDSKMFENCEYMESHAIGELDWSVTEKVFGALTVDSAANTYGSTRFPKACPALYRLVKTGEDKLLVKQVVAVPTEFFADKEMGEIIQIFVDKDPHFNFIDATTNAPFDKNKSKGSFFFWAKDKTMDHQPITDFIKVPIKRSWVKEYRKNTDHKTSKYMLPIRHDDIRNAVDVDDAQFGGINLDSIVAHGSNYQPLGIPCFISRAAFGMDQYRTSFISTFNSVFGTSKPPGKTMKIDGVDRYMEEVSDDEGYGQYDTCFPVVFGAKDEWLGFKDMQPYLLFVERSEGAPALTVESAPSLRPKDTEMVYVAEINDGNYLYYDKLDVRDPGQETHALAPTDGA